MPGQLEAKLKQERRNSSRIMAKYGSFYLTLLWLSCAAHFSKASISVRQQCVNMPNKLEQLNDFEDCVNINLTFKGKDYDIGENITLTKQRVIILNGNYSTVHCVNDNVGLILRKTQNISISNILISGCGTAVTIDQAWNVGDFRVAIYIDYSNEVYFNNVTIENSNGIGLTLIDNDFIHINNSVFRNNSVSNNGKNITRYNVSGGIHIVQFQVHSATIQLTWCRFIKNGAFASKEKIFPLQQNKEAQVLFGMGGGLSINLNTSSNCLSVSACLFANNSARIGGGMFVSFINSSSHNSIQIEKSTFTNNVCIAQKVAPSRIDSLGGGFAALYLAANENKCHIRGCHFINNTAYHGGGLCVGAMKDINASSTFIIEGSQFSGNYVSAMDAFCYNTSPRHYCSLKPIIRNTIFARNGRSSILSVLRLYDIRVKFEGNVTFDENYSSGAELNSAVLEICSNATALFKNNSGRNGGGIVIIGESFIELQEEATLTLIDNVALEQGGGIYVVQPKPSIFYSHECFMKIKDNEHVNVVFINNTANREQNAIFASSFFPCVQESIFQTFCEWPGFTFGSNNCTDLIKTLPRNFTKEKYDVTVYPNKRKIISGFGVLDDFENNVINETEFVVHFLSSNYSGKELSLNSNGLLVNADYGSYRLMVETAYYRSVSTIINVEVQKCPIGYEINATTNNCECSINDNLVGIVNCKPNNYSIDVFIGYCAGVFNSTLVISKCPFTANYFKPRTNVSNANESNFNELFCRQYKRTGYLCQYCKQNSTQGIDIFSSTFKCVPCNHSYINWIKGVAAVIGPQTIFFGFVFIFHVGITAPTMTGYIFFSHVVALPLEILMIQSAWKLDDRQRNASDHSYLSYILMSPYRIWSFDYPEIFKLQVCLHRSMRIMHAIAFRYLHALYPTLLLAVALLFIELHARNCKPVVYLWKPLCILCVRFRRKWVVKTSIIDAFATVILLSYSKIVNTSLYLLTKNDVIHTKTGFRTETRLDFDTGVVYLKEQHIIFASVAIVVLLTFGLIPPVLLLCYPYQFFSKILIKLRLDTWHGLHVFMETFHGSFKNRSNDLKERRWFAGVYFIFRIVVFLVFALSEEIVQLHLNLIFTYVTLLLLLVFLRPYKNNYYTYLDASFISILIIVNCLVVYLTNRVQLTSKLSITTWRMTYALLWLPTLYLIVYLLFIRPKCIRRFFSSKWRQFRNRTFVYFANTPEELVSDCSTTPAIGSDLPTHSSLRSFINNPDYENSINTGWPSNTSRHSSSKVSVEKKSY